MASAKLQASTEVQPKDFTYLLGQWIVPTEDYQPAELIRATLVKSVALVRYDTSSDNEVKITFDLFKPSKSYGWGTDSDLAISVKVGENGVPIQKSINKEFGDMKANTNRSIHRIFDLKANHQATDGKLHVELVDMSQGAKGGLDLNGATVDVMNP